METGNQDSVSYVLQQDKVTLVLTSPLQAGGPINDHINRHGDGVKAVALWVDDATKSWKETTQRGAVSVFEPQTREDADGQVVMSAIENIRETPSTSFVERKKLQRRILTGLPPLEACDSLESVGLEFVDHMVGNVGWGEMNTWVDFYARVMGFAQLISFDDKDISTEYTALMSKVMSNGNGRIKFPSTNQPRAAKNLKLKNTSISMRGLGFSTSL